ncbi:hypothetical protein PV326_005327 [Microctonus aethiopoides]|nr:hypothetical protein PV326_005327 [Microctonus aethiopoides]
MLMALSTNNTSLRKCYAGETLIKDRKMQYVDRVRRQHAGGGLMLLFDKKFDCRETEIQENVLANLQDAEALVVVLDDIVYLVAYIPPKIKININD